MSQQILQVDQAMLETTLDRMVRKSVEETLNAMLDAEADEITGAARYERSGERKAYRAGHYERDLTVKAGKMSLKVPKLKGAVFESAVIERYRRREESVEEALIDMYLAGVSTRQVDDVSQLLWGDRMPSQTLSDKLKKVYADIDEWRGRPLEQDYPYLFMDGVWHKRCWGGSVENVSILVAVGVGMDGRREVLSVAEGMKEDSESWREFIKGMLARGLKGVRLVTGDRCAGLVAAVNELLPGARYQRCMVHFERNILAKVNPKNRDWAADALKAIFSMESRDKALEKAESVAKDMEARKLREAAKCLREGIGETTTYLLDDYPREHRRRIRTNNMIERLNREIRRRTRVVGSFPDGRSALMLICARVRYVTSSEWSTRRYLDMSRLGENVQTANRSSPRRRAKTKVRKNSGTT
ncbi:IS256 family transposase, partial [Bifidobacterium longum]